MTYYIHHIFKKSGIYELIYSIIVILIFSVIYCFFEDNEFGNLVYEFYLRDTEKNKIIKYLFNKYSNNKEYLTYQDFIKIPLEKVNGFINYSSNIDMKLNNTLFSIYNEENKINYETFKKIPINILSNNNNYISHYLYRLYYATIVQTTLGLGDTYPSTKRMKLVTMIQVLSTLVLFII